MNHIMTIILALLTVGVIILYIKFIKLEVPEGVIKDPYGSISKFYDVVIFILIALTSVSYLYSKVKSQNCNNIVTNTSQTHNKCIVKA